MGKDKLRRFAEITAFANVIELEEGKRLNGQWAEQHFKNQNPVVLELGCGKGEYELSPGRWLAIRPGSSSGPRSETCIEYPAIGVGRTRGCAGVAA